MPGRKLFNALRGSIELSVAERVFDPGDFVPIEVHLTTRRALGPGNLTCAIVLNQRVRSDHSRPDGSNPVTDYDTGEIFRLETVLAEGLQTSRGHASAHQCLVQLPHHRPMQPQAEDVEWLRVVPVVQNAIASADRVLWWEVVARYDIPGLDLTAGQKLATALR